MGKPGRHYTAPPPCNGRFILPDQLAALAQGSTSYLLVRVGAWTTLKLDDLMSRSVAPFMPVPVLHRLALDEGRPELRRYWCNLSLVPWGGVVLGVLADRRSKPGGRGCLLPDGHGMLRNSTLIVTNWTVPLANSVRVTSGDSASGTKHCSSG